MPSDFNCDMDTVYNLYGIRVLVDVINEKIDVVGKDKLVKWNPKLMDGIQGEGLVTEKFMMNIFQSVCDCDVRKLISERGKSNIVQIPEFVEAYEKFITDSASNLRNIFVIGWAGKGSKLDNGITHFCGIKDGLFYDGLNDGLKEPTPVSAEILADAFYGMELTRLKAYVLSPKLLKTPKKRKLDSDVLI